MHSGTSLGHTVTIRVMGLFLTGVSVFKQIGFIKFSMFPLVELHNRFASIIYCTSEICVVQILFKAFKQLLVSM